MYSSQPNFNSFSSYRKSKTSRDDEDEEEITSKNDMVDLSDYISKTSLG
jgi:uncharacterized metal-binding protein YceD (DUF177 family)